MSEDSHQGLLRYMGLTQGPDELAKLTQEVQEELAKAQAPAGKVFVQGLGPGHLGRGLPAAPSSTSSTAATTASRDREPATTCFAGTPREKSTCSGWLRRRGSAATDIRAITSSAA